MSSLSGQQTQLESIQCLGEQILSSCHPDSVITIKSWISVTKTRYEEVSEHAQHSFTVFAFFLIENEKCS